MLSIGGNQLNTKAITKLATAKWPLLEQLDLSVYPMESQAISCMLSANWPLKVLTLLQHRLIKGDLLLLEELQPSNNALHSQGITAWAQGKWPLLKTLGLHSTGLKEKSFKISFRRRVALA